MTDLGYSASVWSYVQRSRTPLSQLSLPSSGFGKLRTTFGWGKSKDRYASFNSQINVWMATHAIYLITSVARLPHISSGYYSYLYCVRYWPNEI